METVSNDRISVPESPPLSQRHATESQDVLIQKLLEREGEDEAVIIEDCSSPEVTPLKKSRRQDDVEEADEVLIEDDDDKPNVNGSGSGNDTVIDMEVDDDMTFLQTVEEVENQVVSEKVGCHGGSDLDRNLDVRRTEKDRLQDVARMKRLGPSERIFPDVKANAFHTIAFLLTEDYKPGDDLLPFPPLFDAKWEQDYLPFPCAPENTRIFKVRVENGDNNDQPKFRDEVVWMWSRIESALKTPMLFTDHISTAMKNYVGLKGDLKVLSYCLEVIMGTTERYDFFAKALPCMQTLVLDTERLITCPIPLLKKFKNQSISFSQKQVACLLANAFFSTWPDRFGGDFLQFPSINFLELFQCQEDDDRNSRLIVKAQKLRCLLNYFLRISTDMPKGVVTYTRRSIKPPSAPKWASSQKKLTSIVPLLEGTIESEGVGMLQVDFANKFIGGGVLGKGAVQEEILFVIYPELLASRLFTEKLTSHEALIVTGCERFSSYTGYGNTFRFGDDFYDVTPWDSKGRKCTQFVGIDAFYVTRPLTQFDPRLMTRELNKAYAGFSSPTAESVPVATGKWGCGAFNGNPQLKSILQLLAASQAGRDVVFFTFGDAIIQREIEDMYDSIRNCTIEQVWTLLSQYYSLFCSVHKPKYDLCQFLVRYAGDPVEEEDPYAWKPPQQEPTLPLVPSRNFYSRDDPSVQSASGDPSDEPTSSKRIVIPFLKENGHKDEEVDLSKMYGKSATLSDCEISKLLNEEDNTMGSRPPPTSTTDSTPAPRSNQNYKQPKLTDFYK